MPVGRPSTRGRRVAVSEPPRRDFDEPGPQFSGDDQEAPLSPEDIAIKREFDEALAAEEMKRCPRCKERWFDVKLMADGVCKRCHDKDDMKRQDEPLYFSAANHLDFGSVPPELPQLEPLEEMFIARVHVSANIFTVRSNSSWNSLELTTIRFAGNNTNIVGMWCTSYATLARYIASFLCCLANSTLLSSVPADHTVLSR
jgi:hypothetical protein